MFKGLGQLGDMAKMMKAAQNMQEQMQNAQERLAEIEVEGEAGAGLVKARASAKGELRSVEIDPSILVPSEREVIEDLVLAAVRDALERAQARSQTEMKKIAEDMGLPPGIDFPG